MITPIQVMFDRYYLYAIITLGCPFPWVSLLSKKFFGTAEGEKLG